MESEIIFLTTFILLIIISMLVILFSIFQTKKNAFITDKIRNAEKMEAELIKSQIEIKEQSLRNISWELHDNVGQLLSTAKIHLNLLEKDHPELSSIKEINELVGTSMQDIRSLSKTLNQEVIKNIGIAEALKIETERFNRLKFLKAHFNCSGKFAPIEFNDEIILFRILQEFLSNVIKHSKAENLKVNVHYTGQSLLLEAVDDGIGFDADTIDKGSGLINMESRAALVGASFNLQSGFGSGVCLRLEYPFKDNTHAT